MRGFRKNGRGFDQGNTPRFVGRLLVSFAILQGLPSCSSEDAPQGTNPTGCESTVDSIYAGPDVAAAEPGTILRCAVDRSFSKDEIDSYLRKTGYEGAAPRTGVRTHRILYGTTRAGGNGVPGYSSGLLVLPETPRAEQVPLVSVSHGAWGQAPACTQSEEDPREFPDSDFWVLAFAWSGQGFPVVASDYAGFSNYGAPDNPPSGFAFSEDVARSTLDSLRAARDHLGDALTNQNLLVGQSQGAHTVLSTLAWSERYARELSMSGAVTFAPLWFNQSSWAAMFLLGKQFAVARDTFPTAVGLWYMYSLEQILDANHLPEHSVFAPEKRAIVKEFFDNNCSESHYHLLRDNAVVPADLYARDFVEAVQVTAGFGEASSPCASLPEGKSEICARWMARFAADRPHLEGAARDVPLLVLYGAEDNTIPPERMVCGLDRLATDGANMSVCYAEGADHNSLLRNKGDFAIRWAANHLLDETEPNFGECLGGAADIVLPSGEPAVCAVPPPND